MFWKLSSLQNVEETRVVPYCKGVGHTGTHSPAQIHAHRNVDAHKAVWRSL